MKLILQGISRFAGCLAAVVFLLLTVNLTAQVPVIAGGAGAPAGTGVNGNNNAGGNATGLGCGGGGGSWWGGTGGAGKYGGGGAGAGGYFSLGSINWAGGDGGQGVVVLAFYNGVSFVSSVVLISGSSTVVPAGVNSVKGWAIGAGGGGGGATSDDGTAGGGGGAGGVAWLVQSTTPGNTITYSLGPGGKGGHGSDVPATSGGTTSVTIEGSTVSAYGGSPGAFNNLSTASGGSYSGGNGASGGTGAGSTGDDGGGGGGAIGGANGSHNGNDGGTGANSVDVSGLFAACASAGIATEPSITSFSPTAGLSGTEVTINGSGFSGVTNVRFGGIAATSFTVNSPVSITAIVASTTVTGSVSVDLTYVTISKPLYQFTTPVAPTVDSFSPVSATTGGVVTISGNKFLGVTAVSFGGTAAASFTVNSDFQISATVGAGSSGSVSVTSSSGTGTRSGFTFVPSGPGNPPAVTASENPVCNGFSSQLTALGAVGTVYWYTGSCGGVQVATGNPVVVSPAATTTYYARNYDNGQFSPGCASIVITVNQPSYVATNPTVAGLVAAGTGIQWYAEASGGSPLSSSATVVNGNHYFASQTVNGVESATRLDVTAVVDPTPCKPTGSASQSFSPGATIASLSATGSNIRWYLNSSGGSALPSTTALVTGTHYYASQTVDCTESASRFDVSVTIN